MRKLGARGYGPGPVLVRGSQRRQEQLRNPWQSPSSWVPCPKRQKHIIQHLRNEGVTTLVAPHLHPAAPQSHPRTVMDFLVAPGSALQVNFGPSGARLARVPVGKGVA